MVKKNDSRNEKSLNIVTNLLIDLLRGSDPIAKLKREYKSIPLRKKGNIEYEIQWQTTDLEKDGGKVIHIAKNKFGESIIIHQLFYADDSDDETIHLRVKVISNEGVMVPDSIVYLILYPENNHLQIADIRIEGNRVNRGYGSILMDALMQLVHEMEILYITGWISGVDWDHIDRSEHFYKKFGFKCKLDHENKHGTISWFNEALGATQKELDKIEKNDNPLNNQSI